MATQDRCVSIVPYFKVPDENLDGVKKLCEQFVARAATEPKCLYYGFSFNGDEMFCREGYEGAEGALAHLDNVGALLAELLTIASLTRLEIHGVEEELAKLRGPMAQMSPAYFVMEYGIRR